MQLDSPVLTRMQVLIDQWKKSGDQRAVFLTCYQMMTRNMLAALERGDFKDRQWVHELLQDFAGYYFRALDHYEQAPTSAPAVWRLAHRAALQPDITALQKLLLGVNAHINYDLVLTLVDLLQAQWNEFSSQQRAGRYADYCTVNDVIGQTIDAVQDQVLEPAMPILDLFDRILGRSDEQMISGLITHWRTEVWQQASTLLECREETRRASLIRSVEEGALRYASAISLTSWRALADEFL